MHVDVMFANKEFLLLGLLIPLLIVHYYLRRRKRKATVVLSTLPVFEGIKKTWKERTVGLPFLLRLVGLALLVVVLARPKGSFGTREVKTEGIDIMLALDISNSMLAKDLKPDRLEASREIAIEFVRQHPNDGIGLVLFSGESFTQCPVTMNHGVVIDLLKEMRTGMVTDGTAIGEGLAGAVSRLRTSTAKSKVIILLTDGVNNSGSVDPLTAGEIAKTYGIRVYSIGVGAIGKAESPTIKYVNGVNAYGMIDVRIDEKRLKAISETTGGKYFRATDKEALKNIYEEIDQLEKTLFKVKEFDRRPDLYFWVLALALFFLLTEFLLRTFVYRGIP